MYYNRIRDTYTKMTDGKLIFFGEHIIKGVSNNPLLPNIEDKLLSFKYAFNSFKETIPNKINGNISVTEKREKKAVAVRELLRLSYSLSYATSFERA